MRHWTRRITLQYSKVGQALNASNAEINRNFLHENIRGILLRVNLHPCWPRVARQALKVKALRTVGSFHILQKSFVHSGKMLHLQREMPRP